MCSLSSVLTRFFFLIGKNKKEILRREKEEPPLEGAASDSCLQLGAGTAQTGSEVAPAAWL